MEPWQRISSFRARRRLRHEAHLLMKEGRRIRRRWAHRLRPSEAETLAARLGAVAAALAGGDGLKPANDALGALLDDELAYARKSTARQYVESIGSVVFVALLLRSFVVEAYQIPSGSMIPTLEVGDHIWVNKLVYGLRIPFTEVKFGTHYRPPRRGEIVVFTHPRERDKDLIKRVIGVGGDVVEMRDNVVRVNGVPLARQQDGVLHYFDFDEGSDHWVERDASAFVERTGSAEHQTLQDPSLEPRAFGPVRVPDGHLFVMGDNRDNSSDSRYWGFVPLNLVRGRAMVVWWSYGQPEGVRVRRFGHLIH